MAMDPTPEVGAEAPAFTLPGTAGKTVSLADFRGRKNVVLYFYPKDGTPGCTLEACGFRDQFGRFEAQDTVIFGVSRDDLDSHRSFSARHRLPFLLLSDPGAEVARAYGAFGPKTFMGREFHGISRATFVIDKQGTIRRIYAKIKVKGHAAEVLEFVRDRLG
jgi:peroxiredoxin Q/BCP